MAIPGKLRKGKFNPLNRRKGHETTKGGFYDYVGDHGFRHSAGIDKRKGKGSKTK